MLPVRQALSALHVKWRVTNISFWYIPWQLINILKFRFRELFFVPAPDLPAEFGADQLRNGRGVSGQTNTQTLLKF